MSSKTESLLPVASNVVLPLLKGDAQETEEKVPQLSSLACREVLLQIVRKRKRCFVFTELLQESPFHGEGILEKVILSCRLDKAGEVVGQKDVVEVVQSSYGTNGKTFTKDILPLTSLPFRVRFAVQRMIQVANVEGKRCSDSSFPRFCGPSLLIDLHDREEFFMAYKLCVEEESLCCVPAPLEVEQENLSFGGDADSFEEDCWVLRAEENENFVKMGMREDLDDFISSWQSLLPFHPSPLHMSAAFARLPRAVLHVDVME